MPIAVTASSLTMPAARTCFCTSARCNHQASIRTISGKANGLVSMLRGLVRERPGPAMFGGRAEGEEMTAKAENSGKLWTAQEDERLRELAVSSATPFEIAAKLNRTEAATKARAYVLRVGLRRFRARRRLA